MENIPNDGGMSPSLTTQYLSSSSTTLFLSTPTLVNSTNFNQTAANVAYNLDEFSAERIIYIIITLLFTVFSFVSFGILYHYRNWYIIRQRNFKLTLIGGISSYIAGLNNLITQCFKSSCGISLYITNIVGPFSYLVFLSRAIRLVILYKLNIYKVTTVKKKRMVTNYNDQEPNQYLAKIYNKVDKIIIGLISIPTVIFAILSVYVQQTSQFCTMFDFGNASENLRNSQAQANSLVMGMVKEFMIMQLFGNFFSIVLLILFIFLRQVKDSHKFGLKFDCISTAIVCIICQAGNVLCNILQRKSTNPTILHFISIFKQGKVFFVFVSVYIIFASIVLPIYLCYRSSYEKNKYFHEPTSSIQYFYKILNSPALIEELKAIAIKEFCVENILFWENYQILQKMVYRYQIEYRRAERDGNPQLLEQYNFEAYYQYQLQTHSTSSSSLEDYSYDPNMTVPEKLMPYYISFYHTFIDISGPASVNISGRISRQIYNEFCSFPTIGIFDEAKNEIVEIMYNSIFPILLRQNRQNFGLK